MKAVVIVLAVLFTLSVGVAYVVWRYVDFGRPATGLDRGSVTLEVTNGCGVPRMARAIADELLRRGFDVYQIGNDSAWEHTTLVDLRDPTGARAELVAAELSVQRRFWFLPLRERHSPEWVVQLDSGQHVELRLVVGHDYPRFFPEAVVLR